MTFARVYNERGRKEECLSLSFRTVLCYAVLYTFMSSYYVNWESILIHQYGSRQIKDINTIHINTNKKRKLV